MTIGGSEHPTRYVTFKDNSVFGSTDAGVDTHAQAEFIIITGNLIQSGESDGEGDGIYTAGRNITISNNTIMNTGNHGISVLNGVADTNLKSSYTITGNTIVDVPDKGICINQGTTGGIIYGLIISNNSISFPGDMGIRIHAEYAGITHVLINGNYISGVADAGDSVIQIDAATSYDVKWFSITGNVLHRADDADNCIEMVGADATSVTYGAITGNVIHNGTYGVKGTNDDYLVIDSNVFSSMATGDTDVAGTNTIGDNES